MRSLVWLAVAAGVFGVTIFGASAVQAADGANSAAGQKPVAESQPKQAVPSQAQVQERWRYTFHNNEWWYWLPSDRWVYWRDNRWNDYNPKTYVAPVTSGVPAVASRSDDAMLTGQETDQTDISPFYGRTLGTLDQRPTESNGEVGPFYGNALPNEVFGPWRAGRANRPFYGHSTLPYGN